MPTAIVIQLPRLPKNHYRIIHPRCTIHNYYTLQVWRWWWPFWSFLDWDFTIKLETRVKNLTEYAHYHASGRKHPLVADLGPLP